MAIFFSVSTFHLSVLAPMTLHQLLPHPFRVCLLRCQRKNLKTSPSRSVGDWKTSTGPSASTTSSSTITTTATTSQDSYDSSKDPFSASLKWRLAADKSRAKKTTASLQGIQNLSFIKRQNIVTSSLRLDLRSRDCVHAFYFTCNSIFGCI